MPYLLTIIVVHKHASDMKSAVTSAPAAESVVTAVPHAAGGKVARELFYAAHVDDKGVTFPATATDVQFIVLTSCAGCFVPGATESRDPYTGVTKKQPHMLYSNKKYYV
jgi:hypothetical protein